MPPQAQLIGAEVQGVEAKLLAVVEHLLHGLSRMLLSEPDGVEEHVLCQVPERRLLNRAVQLAEFGPRVEDVAALVGRDRLAREADAPVLVRVVVIVVERVCRAKCVVALVGGVPGREGPVETVVVALQPQFGEPPRRVGPAGPGRAVEHRTNGRLVVCGLIGDQLLGQIILVENVWLPPVGDEVEVD